MRKHIIIFLIGFTICFYSCDLKKTNTVKPNSDITAFVNPFIGTGGHGHTFPGATVPFGMLQVSPDNGTASWDWCSGYHYTDSITIGFSHLHLSGTGIGDLYDIRVMPINKKVDISGSPKHRDSLKYASKYTHKEEKASPGYYSVTLQDHNIKAEISTSKRSALHKYTFKKDDEQSIILDLGFSINWDSPLESKIEIIDKHTICGYRYSTGWAKNQKVYYVIKSSKAISGYDLVKDGDYISKGNLIKGITASAQVFFNTLNKEDLKLKVALSSVSEENAILNLNSDENGFNFEETKNNAELNWHEALSKIKVETPNEDLKTIFYSSLYHTQLAPVTFSDINGEFRLENDSIAKSESFTAYSTFSIWDTFRAENPLLNILEPQKSSDIVNSMLAYYKVNKVLPVWTLYGNETNTMTGYHSIPVIAEAYLKGIEGFDIVEAYDAMKNTLMGENRGLSQYKEHGYIPYDLLDESVTITLELAYDDWCLAEVAKALGKMEDYKYFSNRSKAYKYLFDNESQFMRGKSQDGISWHEPFDPKYSAHRVHADYTEGNAWQHSWFVLHDVPDLISLHGGSTRFAEKLENLFTETSEITGDNVSVDITGLIGQYAHGNEPSHHIAYMFNYAKQPWRTQYWVREILKTQYKNAPDGLSGNEDCGQMSAWFVFSSMGLYPLNPASKEYQIGSPLFEKSSIKVANNNTFNIIANKVSDENKYILSATLNGQPINRSYITHNELMRGGVLEFEMTNTPNKNWGIAK